MRKQSSRLRNDIKKQERTKPKNIKMEVKRIRRTQKQQQGFAQIKAQVLAKPVTRSKQVPQTGFTLKDYEEIPSIPSYHCTEEEFNDPMKLLEKLRALGYDAYGCVKLIPPKSFKIPFCFDGKGKPLTTRKQVLQDLTKAVAFEQNVEAYTFKEFEKFANKQGKILLSKSKTKASSAYRAHEFDFWSIVDHPNQHKEKVEVEYAADLSSFRFGSAFPSINSKGQKRNDMEDERYDDAATQNFNLNVINATKDSLFQMIKQSKDSISGITTPWVYLGMLYANFCWHVEDNYMYSLNYMHKGAAKTWYCVPGKYKEEFDKVIKSHYADLFQKRPNVLYDICLMLNPLELKKKNIPVYRTEQEAGEFILTLPKVYHSGFSHGFNVGEAVNLAAWDWLDFNKQSYVDYAKDNFSKRSSFSHEWLVFENVKQAYQLTFTKSVFAQILRQFDEIRLKEKIARENCLATYKKLPVLLYPNKECRYDQHECSLCGNYPYLSYLECSMCNKKACASHISVCSCLHPKVTLHVRYTCEEIAELEHAAKKLLQSKKN